MSAIVGNEPANIVVTKNGQLQGVTDRDVAAMVAGAAASPNGLVLYFHGGLVPEAKGKAIAEELHREFGGASVTSVFSVWNSGPIRAVGDTLGEIVAGRVRRIFISRVERMLRRQAKRGRNFGPAPALTGEEYAAIDREIDMRLEATQRQQFVETPVKDPHLMRELTDVEAEQWAAELALDDELLEALFEDAYSAGTLKQDDISGLAPAPGSAAALRLSMRLVLVGGQVILRFINGRHHGVHATIVEELLRAYALDVSKGIWSTIKDYTADAFIGASGGGSALIAALKALQAKNPGAMPKVTLIGHSAGAVYITHLIAETFRQQLPLKFDVILLAPAVSFATWHERLIVTGASSLIGNLRIFVMDDATERDDTLWWKLKIIYPSSLLYLVSGACEKDADEPLLGLERFHVDRYSAVYGQMRVVRETRAFLATFKEPVLVLSPASASGPAGASSEANEHGDFDGDSHTRKSMRYILTNGFDVSV